MNKPILLEIIACIVLGTILGIAFWLFDGGKTCKKVSKCPGKASSAQEMAFKNEWERESRIREIKNCLESYQKGLVIISLQGLYELRDELHRLSGDSKQVKIYAGQWIEDIQKVGDFWSVGYLEVIGK